jgi:hypothetical protein
MVVMHDTPLDFNPKVSQRSSSSSNRSRCRKGGDKPPPSPILPRLAYRLQKKLRGSPRLNPYTPSVVRGRGS